MRTVPAPSPFQRKSPVWERPRDGVRGWLAGVAVVVTAMVVGIVVFQVTRSRTVRWAEAYAQVLAQIQSNSDVRAALGAEPEPEAEPTFLQVTDALGKFEFPIKGSLGTGSVRSVVSLRDGKATVISTEVRPDATDAIIRVPAPPASRDQAAAPSTLARFSGPANRRTSPLWEVPGGSPSNAPKDAAGTSPSVVAIGSADPDDPKRIIMTVPGEARFDPQSFTVQAGTVMAVLLVNKEDPLEHNLIFLKGKDPVPFRDAAARWVKENPKSARARGYIPDDPALIGTMLAHTLGVHGPGSNETVRFRVPDQSGRYPYVCTCPGHSHQNPGIMVVE